MSIRGHERPRQRAYLRRAKPKLSSLKSHLVSRQSARTTPKLRQRLLIMLAVLRRLTPRPFSERPMLRHLPFSNKVLLPESSISTS